MAEKKKYNSILVSGRKDETLTYSKYVKDEESGESVKESLDKKVNSTDKLESHQIKDGAITNEKLAADSVGNSNLQDGSVSNEKLEDGSITNEKLAENSITKDKLKDNTIGVEKLDPELRQTINAATGLPENLVETIQNIDDTLKDHQSQLNEKQSQIDDKQQQITANDEDISLLQTRSTQMEETIKSIAATGGASQATAVTYNNTNSQLSATNIQSAVDELQGSKIDKTSIAQESGDAEDKVMSQKAVSTKLSDLSNGQSTTYTITEKGYYLNGELKNHDNLGHIKLNVKKGQKIVFQRDANGYQDSITDNSVVGVFYKIRSNYDRNNVYYADKDRTIIISEAIGSAVYLYSYNGCGDTNSITYKGSPLNDTIEELSNTDILYNKLSPIDDKYASIIFSYLKVEDKKGWQYAKSECRKGDTFIVSGNGGSYENAPLWIITDGSVTILKTDTQKLHEADKLVLECDINGVIYFNNNASNGGLEVYRLSKVSNSLNKTSIATTDSIKDALFNKHTFVGCKTLLNLGAIVNGVLKDSTTSAITDFILIDRDCKLFAHVENSYTASIIYYNKNKEYIKTLDINGDVEIGDTLGNVWYIRIQVSKLDNSNIYCKNGHVILEGLTIQPASIHILTDNVFQLATVSTKTGLFRFTPNVLSSGFLPWYGKAIQIDVKEGYNVFVSLFDKDYKILKSYYGNHSGYLDLSFIENATFIIVSLLKNDGTSFTSVDEKKNFKVISLWMPLEKPELICLPKEIYAIPSVSYVSDNFAGSKDAMLTKHGIMRINNTFLITYARDVSNLRDDFPVTPNTEEVGDSKGRMAIEYTLFTLVDDVYKELEHGTLATIGTSYIDRNGETKQFVGGSSYSTIVNGKCYFSSAIDDVGNSLNGKNNYGLIPCAIDIVLTENSVSFSTPKELTLDYNGTIGRWDMKRIDKINAKTRRYYTSNPPYYDNLNGYIWLQPTNNGMAYLVSSDGYNWSVKSLIDTSFKSDNEITCQLINNQYILFAAREQDDNADMCHQNIGLVDKATGTLVGRVYALNADPSRPSLVKTGDNECMLFYNEVGLEELNVIRIYKDYQNRLHFFKWFGVHWRCTQYVACEPTSVANQRFTDMYLIGGDRTPTAGATFLHLKFDSKKPHGYTEQAMYLI